MCVSCHLQSANNFGLVVHCRQCVVHVSLGMWFALLMVGFLKRDFKVRLWLLWIYFGGTSVYAMTVCFGKRSGWIEKLLKTIWDGCLGSTSAMTRASIVSCRSVGRLRGTAISGSEAVVATTKMFAMITGVVTCSARQTEWFVTLCLHDG